MKKLILQSIIFIVAFAFSVNPAFAMTANQEKVFKKFSNPISETEPNDTKSAANRVNLRDVVQATLDDEDIDYYELVIPRKGKLSLASYLGNDEDENEYYYNDYSITLYDANGNQLAAGGSIVEAGSYYLALQASLEEGTYYIAVKPDDYSYMGSQQYYLGFNFDYDVDFQITNLAADVSSPQTERNPVTFTASANKAGLEYQFSVQGNVVKQFSTDNTYQWTPTVPGTYTVKVEVRDPAFPDAVVQKEISYTVTAYKPDFTIQSLTPNVKSPYLVGKTITFATKTNKTGLEYQYSVNGRIVQAFGTKNTYVWKPEKQGKYTVKVEVRNPKYPNRMVAKQISYQIVDGKVSVSSLKANLSSPRPTATSIKWTAAAKGVDLEYQFSVYQNKTWKTIQNYSTKNYTYWKPKSAGSYKVMVTVRSKLSKKTAAKTAGYTIYKPSYFSTPTLKSNKSAKQASGTYFHFTAKSSGKYLEYRFRVYNGYYWQTIKDYSSSRSLSWYVGYKGKYKVAVDVRQKGTKKVKSKTLSLDIREAPNATFNADYNIYYNFGYFKVSNYGYSNLKVTKMQILNNGKVIYTYQPKNWVTIGRTYQTYYFYPKKSITHFSYNSLIKVYYTYDGLTHTSYLYR